MLTVQVQLIFRDPANGNYRREIWGSVEPIGSDAREAIEDSKGVALDKLVALELAKCNVENVKSGKPLAV